jgi:hypothetical protein
LAVRATVGRKSRVPSRLQGLRTSGRGFNLFKALRGNFRAAAGRFLLHVYWEKVSFRTTSEGKGRASVGGSLPRPLPLDQVQGPTLSPRVGRRKTPVSRRAMRGEGDELGRGLKVFKALRRNFRAAAGPARGEKGRMRGRASVGGSPPKPLPP